MALIYWDIYSLCAIIFLKNFNLNLMESTMMLASVMGPAFLVFGLSVLLYTKVWVKVVKAFAKNHLNYLPIAFFEIILGLVVISMHNYWVASWEVLVTVFGWWMFIEGSLFMLVPGDSIKKMMKTSADKNVLMLAGVVVAAVGGFLSYQAFLA